MALAANPTNEFRLITPGENLPSNIVAFAAEQMGTHELSLMFDILRQPGVDVVHCRPPDPSLEFKAHYQWQRNHNYFYISSGRDVTVRETLPFLPFIGWSSKCHREFSPAGQAYEDFSSAFEDSAFTKAIHVGYAAQWRATTRDVFQAAATAWPAALMSMEADGTSFFNRMPRLAFHKHAFSRDLGSVADKAQLRHGEWREGFYLNSSLSDDGTVFMGADGEHYYSWGWGWNMFRVSALHSTPVAEPGENVARSLLLARVYVPPETWGPG